MDKLTFISEIKPMLKQKGYRKKGSYWYKNMGEYVHCIQVQGSQWDKNDYYVNIGFAHSDDQIPSPTYLQWMCFHRCFDDSGEQLNISPEALLACMEDIFGKVSSAADIVALVLEKKVFRFGL